MRAVRPKTDNIWQVGLGCYIFGDLDETIQGQVTFRDTLKVPVKGKDNIPIKLKNGDHSYMIIT